MLYTPSEKEKIRENLDKIKEYLESLQPQVRDKITVDFGQMKTYVDWSREQEYHLYIYSDDITARTGGLWMSFKREHISSSTRSTVYDQFDFAVALLENWSKIKRFILTEIDSQRASISSIHNFEI